jgi:hypothetical protein
MASVMQRVQAPSLPSVVFVITLAVILMAAVYVVFGVIDLLTVSGFSLPARS